MPKKRVTMQDIADACGLSRNTVSKVFNGRGAVPESTKALIMKKAEELGYGFPAEIQTVRPENTGGSIALLTHRMPKDAHIGTFFITTFTDQISRAGYTLKMYEISDSELERRILPPHFLPEQTSGIVGIELFDPDYLDMICRLEIPTVIIDSPTHADKTLMSCDFVTMESMASMTAIMDHLVKMGAERFGFVGDREHCGSFSERWYGFVESLHSMGIPLDESLCISDPDTAPYNNIDWLVGRLEKMAHLPDVFVCANDYLAIHLVSALKRKGLSIPDDIMVTGYDGASQSALVEPPLTTVQVPGAEIGRMAADILIRRIHDPRLPFSWTRVRTTPVYRSSTARIH